MATVTITTPSDANLSRTLAYESNNTHVRDASFSSYISSTEDTFILKLAELTRNPSSPTISTGPQDPSSHYQISLGRKKIIDGEISVFGAEKYFNGGMDHHDTPRIVEKVVAKQQLHHQRDDHPNLQFVRSRIRQGTGTATTGTPSTCSEVSWNSQNPLLPILPRDESLNKKNRFQGKRFFASFGRNCSCSDKKSIDVDYGVFHGKEMITKEPIKINQGEIDLVGIGVKQTQFEEDMICEKFDKLRSSEEEKPRKSLDEFGSPIGELKLMKQEKGLNMLTWDAISKIKEDKPGGNCVGLYNQDSIQEGHMCPTNGIYEVEDMESDASSDLFEIESLTGNAHRCLTRQASDGMSSCVTPTFYEPSEASIDWSVVTASAANFSIVSDHEERGSVSSALKNLDIPTATTITAVTKTRTTSAKERRPLIFSGCRSHKAVKVAADAYKMSEKRNPNTRRPQGLSDPLVPNARFQAETKPRHWGAITTRSPTKSQLARASHLLYMN